MSRLLPPEYHRLVAEFGRFPGVGPKAAQRMAQHVLLRADFHHSLLDALDQAAVIHLCPNCRVMLSTADGRTHCSFCCDAERRQDVLLVVLDHESAQIALDAGYDGQLWVLQRLLSPVDQVGPDDIDSRGLCARLERLQEQQRQKKPPQNPPCDQKDKPGLRVRIGLPDSVEGRATAVFLGRLVARLGIKCEVESFSVMFKESK